MRTLIILMFLALNIYADNETSVKSDIKEVNVYLTGAQVIRKSNVNIKKTIIITKVFFQQNNSPCSQGRHNYKFINSNINN